MAARKAGELIIRWIVESFPDGFQWIRSEGDVAIYEGAFELAKLQVSWNRTPMVGVVQDPDMCTFHFLNFTDGEVDDSWSSADYAQVESAFGAFWTAIKDHYDSTIELSEYLWRMDGPDHRPFGDSLSPTQRITPVTGQQGIGVSSPLPPQCALTVTEVTTAFFDVAGVGVPGHAPGTGRTQRRNRWGRFYLPAPMRDEVAHGRFNSAITTDVANSVQTFYNACIAADFLPVMYSPTTGKAWSIDEIRVDDIVDVVRSRRFVTPITRTPRDLDSIS